MGALHKDSAPIPPVNPTENVDANDVYSSSSSSSHIRSGAPESGAPAADFEIHVICGETVVYLGWM